MQLKMYEIIDFPAFFDKIKAKKLPFKTSYRLTLLASEIQKHLDFYQENFHNLLIEYSKKDEQGNPMPTSDGQGVLLLEETIEEAYAKLNELRDLDVELPNHKFSSEAFGDIEITPAEMSVLLPFIEE